MLAHHLAFAKLPDSLIHSRDDCLCYISKVNFGAFGGILAQRFSEANADQRISELNDFIKQSGKDIGWVVSPVATPPDLAERLEKAGSRKVVELTGMALDMDELRESPTPHGLRIDLVEDEESLEDYARIYPLLFHFPIEDWIEDLVDAEKHIFRNDGARWNRWVGYLGDQAVAAGRTGQKDGIAALQILCTLPEFRNKGIGQALATYALKYENRDCAIVWAGPLADRLYSRMGFRKICKTSVYDLQRSQ